MDRCETLPVPYALTSAGVDYLTATAYRTSKHEPFDELGRELLREQERAGHEVKTWRSSGYHGLQSEGVIRGLRYDTHIIKLSSDMAHSHWREVAALASNVSRLDVEITFELEDARPDIFTSNHALALSHKLGRGRRRNVTLIQSTVDGDSIYLGKRSSETYGRMYDKGREQKSAPAGKLIRQELEFKGDTAKRITSELTQSQLAELECHRIVSDYMRASGLQTTWYDGKRAMAARESRAAKPRSFRWLETSCRPSVVRLCDAGRLDEVLDALGLTPYVQAMIDERVRSAKEDDC